MSGKSDKITIEARFWLRKGDDRYLAEGKIELMKAIKETGSISAASRKMGISYKKAWKLVDRLNSFSDKEAVTTEKGGKGGGGAKLSPYGEYLLALYKESRKRFSKVLDDLNKEIQKKVKDEGKYKS
ncbi:MAG: hypothetical protein C0601_04985 [Candidatus Muiribacterium halophilum]|uniref:Uncharacterized protein n=1 Tax=Muiribacterium halophilum TaxID=2053465 RepID=A0A2N5ZIA4_MUIH1|nr:MAG: hypothetical protein C0601_04985 [Candidatus Muirbacterium halophilum]